MKQQKQNNKGEKVIIATLAEAFIKSKRVRRLLVSQIKHQLADRDKDHHIQPQVKSNGVFILPYSKETLKFVKSTFGIRKIYIGLMFDNEKDWKDYFKKASGFGFAEPSVKVKTNTGFANNFCKHKEG